MEHMPSENPKRRITAKKEDGRRVIIPPASAHEPKKKKQPEAGWLLVSEFAEKYDIIKNTVNQWIRKDFLEVKKLDGYRYQILDAQPDKHPGWERYLRAAGAHGYRGEKRCKPSIETPEDTNERRKELLKEKYLPRFIAMEAKLPGRLSYTGRELRDHLGTTKEDGTYTPLSNQTLYDLWASWGLQATTLANEDPNQFGMARSNSLIDKKTKATYLRSDLYRFFTGQWGVKGYSDIDSKLKANILGAPTTEEGYWSYNPAMVYQLDARGFFAWLEDVKPMRRDSLSKGAVPLKLFPWQKAFATEMLQMIPGGRYKYNVGFASAPRGEGKSQIIKLIALFRFFNGYSEDIKIAGNSKLEGVSVHYDEMRDMIRDTPKIVNFPGINLQEKHICIMKGPKDIFNKIECVPKSTGLHPNMTMGLITELHQYAPQDRKFFNNFLSSRRGTPNAMVLVDSTVEDPGTIIHDEWKKYSEGKMEMTYFFHRDCDDGYENPETTPQYLADERNRYSEDEYRKIYENKWGGGSSTYFGTKAIKRMSIAGIKSGHDPIYGPSVELAQETGNLYELETKLQKYIDTKVKESSLVSIRHEIDELASRLIDMDDIYRLPASWDDIENLMKSFGVKAWVIGAGIDRASGEKINSDRTALACVGRGIVDEFTSYYFLLDLFMPVSSEYGVLQERLNQWRDRYYDIDKVLVTEHQGEDLYKWCLKNGFEADFRHTTYKFQKPIFADMYQIFSKGYFKSPTVPYYTDERGHLYEGYTNKDDIFVEELGAFRHVSMGDRGKFGPPDKRKIGGIKDDVIDAVSNAIFACNGEDMQDIARSSGKKAEFKAEIYGNPDLIGEY